MKDKELRTELEEIGLIKPSGYATFQADGLFYRLKDMKSDISLLFEYLGVEIEHTPKSSKLVKKGESNAP